MRNTRVDDPVALIPNRVRGYELVDGKLRNSEFVEMSSRIGADERWDVGVYTENAADRAMLESMDAAFDEGMRYFDPRSESRRTTATAPFPSSPTT